jgi:hypothetical protein
MSDEFEPDGVGNDDDLTRKFMQHINEILLLFQAEKAGEIDHNTCVVKVARKTLEDSVGIERLLQSTITELFGSKSTLDTASVVYVLYLRIIRLEDDVAKLRAELLKERIRNSGHAGEPGQQS